MAPEPTDRIVSFHDLLPALADDRRRLGERFLSASTIPSALQAICLTLIVAVPGLGMPLTPIVAVGSVAALLVIEVAFRARLGLSIDVPAGPRSWGILVALAVALAALTTISLVLTLMGHGGWVAATSAAGLATSLSLIGRYDRAFAADLMRPFDSSSTPAAHTGAHATLTPASAGELRVGAALAPLSSARLSALGELVGNDVLSAHLPALHSRDAVIRTGSGARARVALTPAGRRHVAAQLPTARAA